MSKGKDNKEGNLSKGRKIKWFSRCRDKNKNSELDNSSKERNNS